jgi:hypothetical protein
MSDVIETRTLWESGELVITGEMLPEDVPAEDLMGDFDTPEDEAEFRKHLENGDLEYVGMVVTVTYAGAEIAQDSLWGIESGYLGRYDGREVHADAWEITPADYGPAVPGVHTGTVVMGSSLAGVIDEAIGNARKWADANGSDAMRAALDAAQAWADPNAHKRTGG